MVLVHAFTPTKGRKRVNGHRFRTNRNDGREVTSTWLPAFAGMTDYIVNVLLTVWMPDQVRHDGLEVTDSWSTALSHAGPPTTKLGGDDKEYATTTPFKG